MTPIFESDIEQFVVELLEGQGFSYLAPEEQEAERKDLSEVILLARLKKAIEKLNRKIQQEAKEQALRQVLNLPSQNLIDNNEAFHRMLTEGIEVEYLVEGNIRGDKVWLIDW
jgi:type I restriction enzyme R subunit